MRDRTVTICILFTTLLPLFLGADYERWVHGLVLCSMGATFLIAPPRNRLALRFGWVAFALFAVSLTAFLPAAWFGHPEWRAIAVDELKISLPATLSPQPWFSLESVLLFGAFLLWVYYLLSQPWRREERLFATRALGIALAALTLLSLIGFAIQWTPPLWQGQHYFGPIANRNQTALVLSLAALVFVGCAYYEFQGRHQYRALAWAAGLPFVFAGLVINGSRAGIILFFASLGAWVVVIAAQKRSLTILAIAGSILLFLAASFFLFGGNTLDRFAVEEDDLVSAIQAESRYDIFSGTLGIIANAPVAGIGFASFAPVYALSRDLGNISILARVAQPDNDWLWLAAELGLIGLLLTVVLLAMIARRAFPLSGKTRNDRRIATLRAAALLGAALFCIDGLVNIPGHRMAVVLPGILILGLAVRGNRRPRTSRLLPAIYRAGAAAVIVVGLAWIAGAALDLHIPGRSAVEKLTERAYEAEVAEDYERAGELIEKAILYEPLRYRHYYKRAVFAVDSGRPCEEAHADFALARRLEPTHPIVPLGEAEFWLTRRPRFAAPALAEAIRRHPGHAAYLYRRFVLRRDIDPLFKRGLAEIAYSDPQLQLVYFVDLHGAEFQKQLDGVLERDPTLEQWNRAQRLKLFFFWARSGDTKRFVESMHANPEWQKSGWPELSRIYAREGNHRLALDIAAAHFVPPTVPRLTGRGSIESLRTAFALNETDVSAGLYLYYGEAKLENREAALITLEKVALLPGCPDYALYLLSQEREKAGRLEEAWQSLDLYLIKHPPLQVD